MVQRCDQLGGSFVAGPYLDADGALRDGRQHELDWHWTR